MDESMLMCPVCHNAYDTHHHEAKLLSCHHSACLSCLVQLSSTRAAVRCPHCNTKTSIPEGGIQNLQQNFYITQLLQSKPASSSAAAEICSKHKQSQMFYCSTCSIAICMNCTVLDHDRNKGHVIQDISAVIAELQVKLKENIVKAKRAVSQRASAIEALKTELECLDISKAKALEKVEITFQKLRGELDKREAQLLKEIERQYTERKEVIVKTGQTCRSECKHLTGLVNAYEKLTSGRGTRSELVKASSDNNLQVLIHTPDLSSQGGNILFLYNFNLQPLVSALNEFGAIDSSKDLPSIFKYHVPSMTAAQRATLSIKVLSIGGVALNQYPITAKILDPEEDSISNVIKFKGEGVYEVTFIPQLAGTHVLHLQFQGQIISGSRSFEVNSNDPVMVVGQCGQGQGQLQRPTSVALDTRGNIYIADMGNKRVQIFDKDGLYLNQFGLGSSKTTTYDIAINHATEELLCTKVTQAEQGQMTTDTVRIFSLSGEKKRQFRCDDVQNGLFLTVNTKGWVIVSDSGNNCIHVFSKEGASIAMFGGEGSKAGRFNFPAAVCVGQNDDIIVVDTKNHRVQIFDLQGKYKGQIGSQGKGKGQFYLPRGVTADKHGHILVADSLNRIQIFQNDGQFLAMIASSGNPINDPYNMHASDNGFVFVTDFKNHCVKKYKYM